MPVRGAVRCRAPETRMIVCHCKGVTDRQIKETVRRGARTVEEVGIRCQAGTVCGGCRPGIECILRGVLAARRRSRGSGSPLG